MLSNDELALLKRCEDGDKDAIMQFLATPINSKDCGDKPTIAILFHTIYGYTIHVYLKTPSGSQYKRSISCDPKLNDPPKDKKDRILWSFDSGKPYGFSEDLSKCEIIEDALFIVVDGKVLQFDERREYEERTSL